jgi:hypothetical protein
VALGPDVLRDPGSSSAILISSVIGVGRLTVISAIR